MGSQTHLALEELETGTTASADMAQLGFFTELGHDSRSITTANNDGSTF